MTEEGLYNGQDWGYDGIYPRKAANHHRSGLKLPSVSPSIVTNLTLLGYFLILFPMYYIEGAMLPGMNWCLPEGGPRLSEHDFTKWLGIGCYEENWGWRDWWSKYDIIIGRGSPFHLNDNMSLVRFEKIITRLKYIDE